jgi:3D (Asp-Asp-Asp) domain-containing protein
VWYGPALVSRPRTRSAARLAGASLALVLVGVSAALAAGPTHTARVRTLDSRAHRALLDLYALDTRLHAAHAKLSALDARAAQLHTAQRVLEQEVGATRHTLAVSQHELGDNLSLLYKQGDVNALAVVLGAQSLDDAMTRLDDLNRVADQSRQVVEATASAQVRLGALRSSLAAQSAELDAALADARTTAASLEAARSERVGFITRLRRERSVEVARIEAVARRVETKSASLQAAAAAPDTAPAPVGGSPVSPPTTATEGTRTITVTSTGYSLPGHTATGMPVGFGVVAVDPSVIPLGTRLTIPGYGEGVAADTGGAVRGDTIDLWFPTLAQAHGWGRRTVTVTLH